MRDAFPGYYRPTEQQLTALWQEGLFAFDANVLLNLYRYRLSTRESMFRVFHHLRDRVWVPHQAALEYHRSRAGVVSAQRRAYGEVQAELRKALGAVTAALEPHKRHFTLNVDSLLHGFEEHVRTAVDEISKERDLHPDLLHDDPIRDQLTSLFTANIGPAYPADQEDEIKRLAELRISRRIPPGWADRDKPDPTNRLGDVIGWLQILDKAKESKRPIIFVTDDRKDDWWLKLKQNGQTLGPRPELIDEMAEIGVLFYMYNADQFLDRAAIHLPEAGLEKAQLKEARQDIEAVAQELEAFAGIDPMTGVLGFRALHPRLESELNQARHTGTRLALLMFDVDKFKAVNDAIGHRVGDGVLQQVAHIIRREVRAIDVVARIGGDEFVVMMPGATAADATWFAERVRGVIEAEAAAVGGATTFRVTVSVGVAVFPSSMVESVNALIARADEALSRAKQAGGNRVEPLNG